MVYDAWVKVATLPILRSQVTFGGFMEIISRNQAFTEGKTRFYTGKPCKNDHDCERYTSMGGCVECINGKKKTWVVPKLLRGSAIPAESPRAHQFLIEIPYGANADQIVGLTRYLQHVCAPHYFAELGLRYGPPT